MNPGVPQRREWLLRGYLCPWSHTLKYNKSKWKIFLWAVVLVFNLGLISSSQASTTIYQSGGKKSSASILQLIILLSLPRTAPLYACILGVISKSTLFHSQMGLSLENSHPVYGQNFNPHYQYLITWNYFQIPGSKKEEYPYQYPGLCFSKVKLAPFLSGRKTSPALTLSHSWPTSYS